MKNLLKKLSGINRDMMPYRHNLKEIWLSIRYLKLGLKTSKPRVGIMRVDGRCYHGGLNDRFKGAVSWFNYCDKHNLEFKLHYVYPFKLTDYVIPNEYDWRIEEKDIPDRLSETRIIYHRGEKGERLEKLNTNKSIWYYGNLDLGLYLNYEPYNRPWGTIFKTLFKPSDLVESNLEKHRKGIGGRYVAAVFRFQNLLGDFSEYKRKELEKYSEKENLINRAIQELDKIHEENEGIRVLVTSDSKHFLSIISQKKYVYIIPGNLEHMDSSGRDIDHQQLKSFLDYFMISEASKVYSVVIGKMYRSEFPEYAAKINNVPFIRRVYKS